MFAMSSRRFSLRAVLLFVTAIALILGLYVIPRLREQQIIGDLQSMGVQFVFDDGSTYSTYSSSQNEPAGPKWMRRLLGEHFFSSPQRAEAFYDCDQHRAINLISRLLSLRALHTGSLRDVSGEEFQRLAVLQKLEEFASLYPEFDGKPDVYFDKSFKDKRFTEIADEAAKVFGHWPQLRSLNVVAWWLSDNGIANIAGNANMEELCLEKNHLTDAGLCYIAGMKRLKQLDLSYTEITSAGLAQLAGLTELVSLRLEGTRISDEGLAVLSRFPHLKHLNISQTPISDAALQQVAQLPELEQLYADATKITDEGVRLIAANKSLRELSLAQTRLTGRSFSHLGALQHLVSLNLNETEVDNAGLREISTCRWLTGLSLDRTNVTDLGLSALVDLPGLYSLSVEETALTDGALAELDKIPSVMEVHARFTKITAAGVAASKAYGSDRIVELSEPLP